MNILAIIPARGGSKSIPKKNIKKLAGKPLIAYPIELAKSIKEINKVVVSTDSSEIADIAKEYGAEVPFIRPVELSTDDVPLRPVLMHCVKFLEEKGYKPDIIALLYPICPLVKKDTVVKALEILKNEDCNSVLGVEEDKGRFWKFNRGKYVPFYPEQDVNRQFYKPLYRESTAIYFSNYAGLMDERSEKEKNRLVDASSVKFLIMDPGEMVDIDTIRDWKEAEKKVGK